MTDDKKHDDKDRKKLSDEEMEDVAGGDVGGHLIIEASGIRKDKRSGDSRAVDHNTTRSNRQT